MVAKILLVDDDKYIRSSLRRIFEDSDFEVFEAESGSHAVNLVEENDYDLILMDVKMPDMSGIETLKLIKEIRPKQFVIIMTGYGTTQTAIEAMKFGAFDYILKPFDDLQIWSCVEKALKLNKQIKTSVIYSDEKCETDTSDCIVGQSEEMQKIYMLIGQFAEEDVPVLIRGEKGTGKELVARAIFQNSIRKDNNFMAVKGRILGEEILESDLFGHEEGATTDTRSEMVGKIEQCNKGTLFIDEIVSIPLKIQEKIYSALQQKKITKIGGSEQIDADIRLIAATSKNLEDMVEKGAFSKALYDLLNSACIKLPPLRQRVEDIPSLIQFFLKKFSKEHNKNVSAIAPETIKKLSEHSWPGNIGELENVIKKACLISKGDTITEVEFSSVNETAEPEEEPVHIEDLDTDFDSLLDAMFKKILSMPEKEKYGVLAIIEKEFVKKALQVSQGSKLKAAEMLGVRLNTINSKIKNYRINQ